jgi:hypothetical protein
MIFYYLCFVILASMKMLYFAAKNKLKIFENSIKKKIRINFLIPYGQ